jgi:hypothetical protein
MKAFSMLLPVRLLLWLFLLQPVLAEVSSETTATNPKTKSLSHAHSPRRALIQGGTFACFGYN